MNTKRHFLPSSRPYTPHEIQVLLRRVQDESLCIRVGPDGIPYLEPTAQLHYVHDIERPTPDDEEDEDA